MALLSRGLSTVLLLGAAFLLLLSTTFFSNQDVSSRFETSLKRRNALDLSNDNVTIDDAVSPSVLSKPQAYSSASKKAIPFGHEYGLRHSHHEHANVSKHRLADREDREPVTITMDKARTDGRAYYNAIQAGGRQTQWRAITDLIGHNTNDQEWTINGPRNTVVEFVEPFEDLNIPGDAELNVEFSVDQDWLFLNCHGDVCPKTDAQFRNTYNPAGKTIIAAHNFSPNYQLRKAFGVRPGESLTPEQAAKLPKVKQWCDVTMIMWNSLAGNRAGDLKYIFREHIITSNTRFVMEQCFQNIGQDELLKTWPGQVFEDDDPDFYALLGTPHGRSVAFLLIQHQDEFPGKSIESITVFRNSDDDINDGYHLLFTLTGPVNDPLPDK